MSAPTYATIALCPECVDTIGGACSGPDAEWRPAKEGEPCGAADCEADPVRDAKLSAIAWSDLGMETLETRNGDSLDFPTLYVGAIREALRSAYAAGQGAAR